MIDRAELLEAALDSRPDGIVLLGVDSEVVFWNRAAEANAQPVFFREVVFRKKQFFQRSRARTNRSRKAFVACTASIPFSAAF